MTLLGIESLAYGVDDIEDCRRFYEDFGLEPEERGPSLVRFRLPEGSSVVLRRSDDPSLPAPFTPGPGLREVIWGVDSPASLDAVGAELGRDRAVEADADGTLHTRDEAGIAIGFRVFRRNALPAVAASTENSLSAVTRWNRHRNWFERARPKVINHVVFGVPDVDRAVAFYTERLKLRVSDIMRGFGFFLRCDGRHDHHNLFMFKMPRVLFSHVSFGVENIDELMIGANRMQRFGWSSDAGLGRHRIGSILFYYIKCPAGGQAEYSADSDYLTDDWTPRMWDVEYGQHHWLARVSEADKIATQGVVDLVEGPLPRLAETARPPGYSGAR